MKTVVFLSNSSFSMYFFRKGLISSLVSKGYQIHIIAPYDYKTEELKSLGCIFHRLNFQTKTTNPIKDLGLLWQLFWIYRKINPYIIFQYTIKPNVYGTIAARLNNKKSIAIITGLGYAFLTDNWINKIVQRMYRFSLQFSSKVWFLTTDDRDFFIQKKIVKKKNTFILPGEGVNTSEFAPVYTTTIKSNQPFTFLMISRVLWDKGVKEYVEAARKIKQDFPHSCFQLLGATDVDNPSSVPKATVEEWNAKGYIEYLGLSNDVRNEILKADCIVLPSYREGISKVLMEAASMAKPLLASNVTGCKELIEEGVNGYLCEVKNVDSLIEKMNKILSLAPEDLLKMGEAGRKKIIDEFDEKRIIEIYLNYIES